MFTLHSGKCGRAIAVAEVETAVEHKQGFVVLLALKALYGGEVEAFVPDVVCVAERVCFPLKPFFLCYSGSLRFFLVC